MKDEWRPYAEGLRQRAEADVRALVSRKATALAYAQQAAHVLREEFGATRIVLFGSAARGDFSATSDVDVAAWGLSEKDTFRAIQSVLRLSMDIEINLVDMNTAHDYMRTAIDSTGVDL